MCVARAEGSLLLRCCAVWTLVAVVSDLVEGGGLCGLLVAGLPVELASEVHRLRTESVALG